MTIEKITFLSRNHSTPISCLIYLPEGEIQGVVQLVHGMCEHKERYQDFMGYLSSKGLACCIHDHLGHGESVATPQDLGYFAPESGWRLLVEDTVAFARIIRRRETLANRPYFLMGHSMGSFVARLATIQMQGELTGAIYCGTSGARPEAALGRKLISQVMRLKGPRYRSQTLEQLIFGGYNQRFGTQYTGKEWLSRNLAVGRVHAQDPLCNFCFTTSAFSDLLRLNAECNTPGWFAAMDPHLPILLIAGSQDPVGQYGKGVAQVARRLRGAGSEDVTLRLYPGARHELLNELNREEVYGDILRWIFAHLASDHCTGV